MKTTHLLMLAAAAGAGYVAYRGVKAGGGAGGPIGVLVAGWKTITSRSTAPIVKVVPPNPLLMCGGKPCMGA